MVDSAVSQAMQETLQLYELSLSIGGSNDPLQVCQRFLKTLMIRKNLTFASVWLSPENHPNKKTKNWTLFAAIPRARAQVQEITINHPVALAAGKNSWTRLSADEKAFTSLVLEDNIEHGTLVIFPLKGLGALKLYSSETDSIPPYDLKRLHAIIDKFASALSGALAHQKLQQEIIEHKQAEENLYLLGRALATATNGVMLLDASKNYEISYVNPAYEKIMGLTADTVIGMDYRTCLEPYPDKIKEFDHCMTNGLTARTSMTQTRPNSTPVDLEISIAPVIPANDEITHYVAILDDVTSGKQLERQLQQSQKLEAVGQLAGGIAHDFNNLLAAILGYSQLMKTSMDNDLQDQKLAGYNHQVINAGERGRDLIRRMLDYSRHDEESPPEALNLVEAVTATNALLHSILPSTIEQQFIVEGSIPDVLFDTGKFEQILINLCVNARDAMEGHGKLEITLSQVTNAGGECLACHNTIAGDYVSLTVSDNGEGIDNEKKVRIFDPFFTTKPPGKGSGLGLSIVQSLLLSSNVHLLLDSTLGQGSKFTLLFPPLQNNIQHTIEEKIPVKNATQVSGHILVVEDEPALGEYMQELLTLEGLTVTNAVNGALGLELFCQAPERFDLIVTDQTMPRMSGVEMVVEIRKFDSQTPIIMTTGYSDKIDDSSAPQLGVNAFIPKPADASTLLGTIFKLLETATETSGSKDQVTG